jgi:flagellar hook-basal body complex protein FliE
MNDFTIQNNIESPQRYTSDDKRAPQTESTSFGQMLKDSINEVSQLQQESSESVQNLVTGKQKDIHQTMIAMEKSSVAFDLLMQIRNKAITAYEKIMRMQV